jgi:hypothetical protein
MGAAVRFAADLLGGAVLEGTALDFDAALDGKDRSLAFGSSRARGLSTLVATRLLLAELADSSSSELSTT